MDALRFYGEASNESRLAVDDFLKLYPYISPLIASHWNKPGPFKSNERAYAEYTKLFLDFLFARAKSQKTRYIVEGIQTFVRIPKERLL